MSRPTRRAAIHCFNNLNTSGQLGLPSAEVPLREESVPISGIVVHFDGEAPAHCRWEPDGQELTPVTQGEDARGVRVVLPPLERHGMLVAG